MKILVVGPAWIGDMVMSQALFKMIASRHPNALIDVLAPPWSLPILSRMPEVHKAISFPFQHGELRLRERMRVAQKIKTADYQRAFIIPNSFKSALVPFLAKIPIRTGWKGEFRYGLLNDLRHLNKEKMPLMVQRFLALGLEKDEELPTDLKPFHPSLRINSIDVSSKLSQHQISLTNKPILSICPGAEFGESKRWLPSYFAEVAKNKLGEGWDVWILGSKNEDGIAETIMTLTHHQCRNLVGKTSLEDVIDLMSLSSAIIANDSGLMHIAAALNQPLIAIYGSTPPDLAPPLTQNGHILSMNLACSPCFQRVCPLKHFDCMTKISPEKVLMTINELMKL